MKKSMFVLLILLMATSLFLTACGPKETAEETGYPAVEQPIAEAEEGYPVGEQPPAVPQDAGYPAPSLVFVGTDPTFPPFEWLDETSKEPVGFDIELMKEVANRAGFEVNFTTNTFEMVLSELELCNIDMAIAAITITEDRKEQFLFSDPYIDAGQIIIVEQENTNILSKDDLAGKILGAQLGTTGEIEAKAIEGAEYKPYDTYDLALLDLMNGQIDAVIADNPTALGFIEMNPGKLKTVGEVFTNEFYGIAICKNRQDLLNIINPALQDVIASGFVDELAAKYLTGD